MVYKDSVETGRTKISVEMASTTNSLIWFEITKYDENKKLIGYETTLIDKETLKKIGKMCDKAGYVWME